MRLHRSTDAFAHKHAHIDAHNPALRGFFHAGACGDHARRMQSYNDDPAGRCIGSPVRSINPSMQTHSPRGTRKDKKNLQRKSRDIPMKKTKRTYVWINKRLLSNRLASTNKIWRIVDKLDRGYRCGKYHRVELMLQDLRNVDFSSQIYPWMKYESSVGKGAWALMPHTWCGHGFARAYGDPPFMQVVPPVSKFSYS
jgi:hypothetical protein